MSNATTHSPPSFDALYRSLDFERPLDVDNPADKALYVDGMHSSNGISPVDELRASIEMTDRPGTWLFTGHRGVGKSTELRRMAADLRQQNHLVIVADMGDYLNLAEPVTTESLLLTLVAALADGADRFLGGNPLEASYARRLWDFLNTTEVKLEEVSAELPLGEGGLGFKVQLKDNPVFRRRVVEAVRQSLGTFSTQVRAFCRQVAEDLRKQCGAQARVILILDSLERLRVTGADAQVCYDAIASTFDVNGQYLKLEHIDVVYSVPPYLPFLSPRIGSYFGVEVCTLPHVKVFQTPPSEAPSEASETPAAAFPAGVALMVDAVTRRFPAVEKLIPRALLERLALASSGSVRDYFRLIRSVCTKAKVASAAVPLNDARWVDMAEQVLRNEMPLAEEDIDWLRKVRRTHGTGLDSMSNLHQLARLFDSGMILNYRNGRDWCDVHYLLQAQLAR